jgi:hypothetical protein
LLLSQLFVSRIDAGLSKGNPFNPPPIH